MASNPSFKDLQWLIQAIKSDTVNLQNISFYLSQQPTSKCFQETENSFTLHISKDDQLCFSNLLQVLIASKHTRSLLRNLECHQVVWEPNQLRDLRMLLESCSSVKQLLFQRNVFDKECLLELSDVLKRSGVVKEIMICESGIGSSGAVLLANALKENDNLEELQIWDDSIGSNGADEFSKMIEVNSTLKQLTIFDSNSSIATPLISGNGTLRIYKLDFSGSCTVTCTLGWNTTVKSVDLSGVHLKSQWAKEFRWILEQNQNLIEVNLSNTCLKDKGVVYVSAGLFKNKSLQSLSMDGNWFNGIGVEHLLTPLSRFSSPTVFTVDARSSVSVTKLTHHLKKTSNAILQRVPRVYELCNDLILVNINGIYIRVELGGQFGYYIDILACSTKNLTETLRHLQQLIIPAIHGLCNGVTLNENILRQECVKILMPPRYRRTQFLSLQKLKNALLLVPAESMYDYQHTWSSVTDSGRQILGLGFDYARDLLSDDDFREVLHRRYHDLHNLAQELQDPDLSKEISHLASSSMVHGATGAAAAGALGAMAVGSRTREVDTLQDQRIAQQWVLDFLREHQCSTGKEIAEKFGLWRVRYRDSGQIAWICRRHIIHRAHDIFEVPI